jgi:hypothetical protein
LEYEQKIALEKLTDEHLDFGYGGASDDAVSHFILEYWHKIKINC